MATYVIGDNRFNVTNLMYPTDLMDPSGKYGGNFVMFRINVHEDSYLVKAKGTPYSFFNPNELSPSKRGEVARNFTPEQLKVGSVVAGTAAASTLAKEYTSSAGGAAVASLAAGAAITGAASVAIPGGFKKEYKTMKQAIALYMPGDLSVKYGAQWEETSLDTTAQALGAGQAIVNAVKDQSIAAAGPAASALTAAALNTPGMGQAVSKASGTAANPKKEQLFKNVDFRTFTFSYQFFPRSTTEALAVRNIIKQFKLHMHPEFRDWAAGNFLYIYPSEFDIVYYNNGKENTNLHKHTSCVLTDLSVSYAPQGSFSAFEGGMPSQINVQMTFKELAVLTKFEIDAGY